MNGMTVLFTGSSRGIGLAAEKLAHAQKLSLDWNK
jgi:NAD(P)-dependent dehydrogenase (short-subunit alcohol dehydrogenase family)